MTEEAQAAVARQAQRQFPHASEAPGTGRCAAVVGNGERATRGRNAAVVAVKRFKGVDQSFGPQERRRAVSDGAILASKPMAGVNPHLPFGFGGEGCPVGVVVAMHSDLMTALENRSDKA